MRKVRPDAKSLQTPPCKIGLSGQFGKVGQSVCLPTQRPVCSHSWSRRSCLTSPHRAGPTHTPSSQLPWLPGRRHSSEFPSFLGTFWADNQRKQPPSQSSPPPRGALPGKAGPLRPQPLPCFFLKPVFFNLPHCHFAELPPPPLKTES